MRGALASWRAAVAALLVACSGSALAQTEVSIPSADLSRGPGLMLKAFWFEAAVSTPAPAVVLLHGCGGPYDKRGVLGQRMREYAALLNHLGMHALVVDSLTPRGETQICTQKVRSRLITQAHRRLDALSSLEWLTARSDVDASRLGLMGWSNGGSTVLAATNDRHKEVADADVHPSFAIAFYPGCETEMKRGYETQTRLLLLVGAADDWTPAPACQRLVAQAGERKPEIEVYPGAHHGFDSTAPVRLRTDVPNGAHPGQGVHVGGQPEALKRSRERLLRFLAEVTAPAAASASSAR
jgi:dienelactone hydrolase